MMTPNLAQPAVTLCIVAAGSYFLVALLTGVWKYFHIAASPQAVAPVYVDIAHRAALMYSFASLLLAAFASLSVWSPVANFVAASLPLAFFGIAIGGYILHGVLRDTDNQFLRPHRIGTLALPKHAQAGFMWLLMTAEIGGFVALFAGFLKGL